MKKKTVVLMLIVMSLGLTVVKPTEAKAGGWFSSSTNYPQNDDYVNKFWSQTWNNLVKEWKAYWQGVSGGHVVK